MHPVLASFLSLDAAQTALSKESQSIDVLDAGERAFLRAAREHPEHKEALRTQSPSSPEVETALVFLAAHAAARCLGEDASLAEAAQTARESLQKEGASEEQTEAFLASIILEEAFGYESEAETFDVDFVRETLAEVPALASLSRERLDLVLEAYARGAGTPQEQHTRERVAQGLLGHAWEEGPTPIHTEHLEALLATEVDGKPPKQKESALRATAQLLQVLAREGLIGPTRLARLRVTLGDDDA